jgi:BirA family biotin operon repressor/biotin-[acetyl-CoA-carboxylase] ligase
MAADPRSFANTVVESCESTSDLARQLGEAGFAHGSWVSAREQTRGRGRLGRQWQSLSGNLFLSIVLRVEDMSRWPWVPLTVAVGAARFLREYNPSLDIRLKWPNDLWINGSKLGGILCEAVGGPRGSYIVAGIGVNCRVAPEGLDQRTVSLGCEADEVRAGVLAAILEEINELLGAGPSRVLESFQLWQALAPGTWIEWADGTRCGQVQGLGPSGELRVLINGAEERLYAEDVKIRVRA